MSEFHYISRNNLTVEQVRQILSSKQALQLSEKSKTHIQDCRSFLENKLTNTNGRFYGINTGFGSLCNVAISPNEIQELQEKLVQSHACGMGEYVPQEVVRIILLLKIQSLSFGHSAVRLVLVERLIEFYNKGFLPVIYQLGSLGASGDLAPLAHLSLPLLNKGELWQDGVCYPSASLLEQHQISPLQLQSKEGLALLNGTQFSTAYAVWCCMKAQRLIQLANLCAALSLDAFDCRISPFDERLHQIRPHKGQIKVAQAIRTLLKGSQLIQQEKINVQDPYAFRCVPQVHGASWDTIQYVQSVVETEMNAVTDNPNLFPETDAILSGGNFHAQPIALVLDFLAIALAELGSISERRTYQLISGQRNLPAFLIADPGLNSGMMIPQYTAASIVSQNKQLCTPASIDSIVSSNGQEDHVSMAANAATKAYKVVENVERILAIEFMNAVQALEFRRPLQSSPYLEKIISDYRKIVPPLKEDRILSTDMRLSLKFIQALNLKDYLLE